MDHKRVLITGASGCIGSAIARMLIAQKYTVYAHYFSHQPQISQVISLPADLRKPAEVAKLFSELPPLTAMIHAAGVSHDALVARTTSDAWQDTMRTNLHSSFYLLQHAARNMTQGGRIVMLGSRVGEHGNTGQAAYAASKAAMIALAKSAAREYASQGICVNVICPPFIASPMSQRSKTSHRRQTLLSDTDDQNALSAVCSTVRWLLEDETRFISGQVIHPDCRIGFPMHS